MKLIYNLKNAAQITLAMLVAGALVTVLIYSCKKSPTSGVSIVVRTDIIKYSMLVDVQDMANNSTVPPNVTLRISGRDAASVYNISGKKVFTLNNGQIDIGLNPALVPTATNPAQFTLEISAPGYLPLSQKVIIGPSQQFQLCKLKLLNLNSPPAGVTVVKQQLNVSAGGGLSQPSAISFSSVTGGRRSLSSIGPRALATTPDTTYYDNGNTAVVLPTGTTFYYYKDVAGTATGTKQVPIFDTTALDIAQKNATGYTVRKTGYYQNETYQFTTYTPTKVAYNGPVTVYLLYAPSTSVSFSVFPYDQYGQPSAPIALQNGTSATEDNLLYTSAVAQKVTGLYFVGTLADGTNIIISPDQSYNWFTSYRITPGFINPYTSKPVAPGDSLDIGIDYVNNKTLRSVVLQAANGQLRLQNQGIDGGFYYKAPYTATYNFAFNTTTGSYQYVDDFYYNDYYNPNTHLPQPQYIDDYATIPDVENVNSYASVSLGNGYGFYIFVAPNVGTANAYGKIASASPISTSASSYVTYWNKKWVNSISGSGTINIYNGAFTGLGPLITYYVTLQCINSDGSTHGTAYAPDFAGYVSVAGVGNGFINMHSGSWSTRALNPGATFTAYANLGGTSVSYTQTIGSAVYYPETILLARGSDFCGNF